MKAIIVLLGIMLLGTGCASLIANQGLQKQSPMRVEASQAGGSIGVNLFDLQTVANHPFISLGAAAVDLGLAYGIYALGEDDNTPKPYQPTFQIYGDYINAGGDMNYQSGNSGE